MFYGGIDWLAIRGNGNFTIKKEDLWEGTFTKKVAGDFWSAVLDLPLTQDAIVNTRMTLQFLVQVSLKAFICHCYEVVRRVQAPYLVGLTLALGYGLSGVQSCNVKCGQPNSRRVKSGSDPFTVIVGEQTRSDFFENTACYRYHIYACQYVTYPCMSSYNIKLSSFMTQWATRDIIKLSL